MKLSSSYLPLRIKEYPSIQLIEGRKGHLHLKPVSLRNRVPNNLHASSVRGQEGLVDLEAVTPALPGPRVTTVLLPAWLWWLMPTPAWLQ